MTGFFPLLLPLTPFKVAVSNQKGFFTLSRKSEREKERESVRLIREKVEDKKKWTKKKNEREREREREEINQRKQIKKHRYL